MHNRTTKPLPCPTSSASLRAGVVRCAVTVLIPVAVEGCHWAAVLQGRGGAGLQTWSGSASDPALPCRPFHSYGDPIVVKPQNGWNAAGVSLLWNGWDVLSNKTMTYNDVIRRVRSAHDKDDSTVMVEEAAVPEEGVNGLRHGVPKDYKVYCLGKEILAIQVIDRTKGRKCNAWRDAQWRPLPDPKVAPPYPACSYFVRRPRRLRTLLRAAVKLGAALGVAYRIDFYMTPTGPLFGEFTPWPGKGEVGAISRVWSCRFGSRWRGIEGAGEGEERLPVPNVLRALEKLKLSPLEQCRAVQRIQQAARNGTLRELVHRSEALEQLLATQTA